jgi:hypothetical protein
MPGTRTAPLMTADPDYARMSLNFIDHTGDSQSNSLIVPFDMLAATMETLAAETQERSNASLFEIRQTLVWTGVRSKANALSAVNPSVKDNVIYHLKAGVNTSQYAYIPAVLANQLVTNTDTPNVTALSDWFAAINAVLTGYDGVSVNFVEYKEKNQAVKF